MVLGISPVISRSGRFRIVMSGTASSSMRVYG